MTYFKRLLLQNRDFIMKEVLEIKGFMDLILKHRTTGQSWTKDEKKKIKMHLKNISRAVPVIAIFLLPGGFFLLPFLADVLYKPET
jgi:hypothetical protein